MTVGELLARMSSRELTEWAAYETVHGPLGPRRDDFLAALVAHTIAAVNSEKGKSPDLAKMLPNWDYQATVNDGLIPLEGETEDFDDDD